MTCDYRHRWVGITRHTWDVVDRRGEGDGEDSHASVSVECMSCSEKLGSRKDGEWSKSTPRWVRDLVEGNAYVAATTLKGSAYTPSHAVPEDAPDNGARSVCGVQDLTVVRDHASPKGRASLHSEGGRQPFDLGYPWACQRCVKILGGAP